MRWKRTRPYLLFILLSLGVGALSGFLSRHGMQAFKALPKPQLMPPDFVFPVVWTILYILMGVGAALVYTSDKPAKRPALAVYGIQLAVNFFWSILFFNLQAFLPAFIWLLLLWLLIIAMLTAFAFADTRAASLQLPYLLWVTFAGYLNYAVWMMNK